MAGRRAGGGGMPPWVRLQLSDDDAEAHLSSSFEALDLARRPPSLGRRPSLGRSSPDRQPPPLSHQTNASLASSSEEVYNGDEQPRYRSIFPLDLDPADLEAATADAPVYEEECNVFRSITPHAGPGSFAEEPDVWDAHRLQRAPHTHHQAHYRNLSWATGAMGQSCPDLSTELRHFCMQNEAAAEEGDGAAEAAPDLIFDLPSDVFDDVLSLLPASPDLFAVMAVNTAWRDAARANYLRRVITVPAGPDALLRAIAKAQAGGTLRLQPGVHMLSSELTIDRPLRLLSDAEAELVLGSWREEPEQQPSPPKQSPPTHQQQREQPSSPPRGGKQRAAPASPKAAAEPATYAAAAAHGLPGAAGEVVLVATLHVLLRTRCTALVRGLTLCRMGDEVGYPNAVTYAEAGLLRMERCRVTCGGSATSVPQALRAFDGAPQPGARWLSRAETPTAPSLAPEGEAAASDGSRPSPVRGGGAVSVMQHHPLTGLPPHFTGHPTAANGNHVVHDERTQCPQSGVWVGAAASVELSSCMIACCMGPGVKIYRGRLLAQDNTIAFSSRGANVVANGGHVVLERNEIQGANGDGVSSWNNCEMRISGNTIHANSGAGIAVNTGGGSVTIANNTVYDNACQAVLFATSSKQATLRDNDLHNNDCWQRAQAASAPPVPLQRSSSESSRASVAGASADAFASTRGQ